MAARTIAILACLLFFGAWRPAAAHEISVAVNGYAGTYKINEQGPFTGDWVVELEAGVHNFHIAPGAGFRFEVDENGKIVPDHAALNPDTDRLSLKTATISIAPGNYGGTYAIQNVTGAPGNPTIVPVGLSYILFIAPGNGFRFTVDSNGLIVDGSGLDPASLGSANAMLASATVRMDIGNVFTGSFKIRSVEPRYSSGSRDVILVPGVEGYIFEIAPGNAFRFDLAADGVVAPQDPVNASGGKLVLTPRFTNVRIERGAYSGVYSIVNVIGEMGNPVRVATLVPGVTGYTLAIAPGNSFRFDVDAAGHVKLPLNSAATAAGNTLSFFNVQVQIEPTNAGLAWHVRGAERTPVAGARALFLPKDTEGYILEIAPGKNARFTLDGLGNPVPERVKVKDEAAGVDHVFLLKRMGTRCNFSYSVTLTEDAGPNLAKGAVVDYVVDIGIGRTTFENAGQKHMEWQGEVTIRDRAGGTVVSRSGSIYVHDNQFRSASSDALALRFDYPEGALAGLEAEPHIWDLYLKGGSDIIGAPEIPHETETWNAFGIRSGRLNFGNGAIGSAVGRIKAGETRPCN